METRTRLYLARHGETTASAEFRYIGQTDVDITGNGVEQMERIKQRLRDEEIHAFFSSDLIRARKGAEIIASCHGIEPISCPEFREINLGIWEGMTQEEIMERYPEEYTARLQDLVHRRIEGGESFRDVHERVMRKLSRILAERAGSTIVLLAHGGVNRVILFDALKLDLVHLTRMDQSYGCINIIDYYESGPVVKLVNG
jgi:alpha-ribazole phosphatase/probable phosphoglycerate mutase